MDRRQAIERVREHLSSAGVTAPAIEETSAFGDIGLTSLDVLSLLLDVQREYGLPGDWVVNARFPSTVGEFAKLTEDAGANMNGTR
jgi:hypothetical protein